MFSGAYKTGSFVRSRHGWLYGVPENKLRSAPATASRPNRLSFRGPPGPLLLLSKPSRNDDIWVASCTPQVDRLLVFRGVQTRDGLPAASMDGSTAARKTSNDPPSLGAPFSPSRPMRPTIHQVRTSSESLISFSGREKHGRGACAERELPWTVNPRLSARCTIAKAQKVFPAALRFASCSAQARGGRHWPPVERMRSTQGRIDAVPKRK